jgi:hypothetical protein
MASCCEPRCTIDGTRFIDASRGPAYRGLAALQRPWWFAPIDEDVPWERVLPARPQAKEPFEGSVVGGDAAILLAADDIFVEFKFGFTSGHLTRLLAERELVRGSVNAVRRIVHGVRRLIGLLVGYR